MSMSASGTKRTCRVALTISVHGGKADVQDNRSMLLIDLAHETGLVAAAAENCDCLDLD